MDNLIYHISLTHEQIEALRKLMYTGSALAIILKNRHSDSITRDFYANWSSQLDIVHPALYWQLPLQMQEANHANQN
jgi:hypothetical protein